MEKAGIQHYCTNVAGNLLHEFLLTAVIAGLLSVYFPTYMPCAGAEIDGRAGRSVANIIYRSRLFLSDMKNTRKSLE